MLLRSAMLYWRTLWALRPIQWAYLPLRRVQRQLRVALPSVYPRLYPRSAAPDLDYPPAIAQLAERVAAILADAPGGDARPAASGATIRVLDREVNPEVVDWEAARGPALWTYHLHYFDAAPALAYAAWRGDRAAASLLARWTRSWIEGCRVGRGPGWDPFPIAQRLVNWIWCDGLHRAWADVAMVARLRASALQQAAYLVDHLEYQLMGNHLLKNAVALYLAALVWGRNRRVQRSGERAKRILRREVTEQVLADGGHFERSPMYHDAVLQDLLAVNLIAEHAGVEPPVSREVLRRMATFRSALRHPDGARARFNDTTEGLVPGFEQVSALYALYEPNWVPTVTRQVVFPESGYFGYRDEARGECVLVDAGPPGPRYQPGHAHCDMLSFELSLWGQPWIVDPGVHGYVGDPFRGYVRSTRAHNTLGIARREQSELWGAFRMGRRARVEWARCGLGPDGGWLFDGAYRPYFDRGVLHRRRITREVGGIVRVRDRVNGAKAAVVEGALHFHPAVTVEVAEGRLICRRDGRSLAVVWVGVEGCRLARGESEPISGWFFPAYGVAVPTVTVRYRQGVEGGFDLVPLD